MNKLFNKKYLADEGELIKVGFIHWDNLTNCFLQSFLFFKGIIPRKVFLLVMDQMNTVILT